MQLTIEIPEDQDGWKSYTPEEGLSNIIPEFVEQERTHQNKTRLTLTDIKRFTVSSEVIGIAFPDRAYTVPEGQFSAFESSRGANCMAMFPEELVEDFVKNVEDADRATLPGYVRLSNVTAVDQAKDAHPGGLALSFPDAGYTAPGWIQWAAEGNHEPDN